MGVSNNFIFIIHNHILSTLDNKQSKSLTHNAGINRVQLENLTVVHLVTKLHDFSTKARCIIVFTRTRHLPTPSHVRPNTNKKKDDLVT